MAEEVNAGDGARVPMQQGEVEKYPKPEFKQSTIGSCLAESATCSSMWGLSLTRGPADPRLLVCAYVAPQRL